jgi:hypothetical protein
MRDALGLTLDRVYQWRLLLKEYKPKIVYIKGIHNTIADAISWLECDPSVNLTAESYYMRKVKSSKCSQSQNWMAVSNHWYNIDVDINADKHKDMNLYLQIMEKRKKYTLLVP